MGYDATESINEELGKIYFRSGLTFLILLLFVGLITLNLRYMLIITISLMINLAVAVIFYYLTGIEIQLYSLAGITISLNLIIDNIIVMTDHITHKHNLNAFTSVMAATLTTVGALGIVFFLDESIRLNLQDFVAVVIINLAVSLFVALFLVPALIERIGLQIRHRKSRRGKRWAVRFSRVYSAIIRFCQRWRWAMIVVLILGFGLPVFMLPESVGIDRWNPKAEENLNRWQKLYNSTLGSKTYKEKVKPVVDVALGGSLRLFVQDVYAGSYFNRGESEPSLQVYATLPNGSTLEQMNELITKMESYLTGFSEIRQFQTSISSPYRASIYIVFTKEAQKTYFPYQLKSDIIRKAQTLGGGSWSIYGLEDQGFNNDVRESAGSYRVKMLGYNYDELYEWAEKLKAKLLTHRRIKEVLINSEFSWWKDDYQEFYFNLNKERMAQEGIDAQVLFSAVRPIFGKNLEIGSVAAEQGMEKIKLSSRQSAEYDIWAMQFFPYGVGNGKHYKLSELTTVEKGQMPQEIAKENQQYRLCLQYEYIGSNEMGNKIQKRVLEEFNKLLPMGYTAESDSNSWSWGEKDNRQYLLLLVVIAIIFFTTSVLFNSLKQPLAIIFVIPVSYIGVFLTFYWFRLNFDQGGFASFVLLCGITVNASIYVLNEYNSIRRRFPRLSALRAYVKAWNAKVVPIFLTVVSTILGFIPFMIGEDKEAFWFPLAAGTIGGLVMSVIGIFFFLPVFVLKQRDFLRK